MLKDLELMDPDHRTNKVCGACGSTAGLKALVRHNPTGQEFVLCRRCAPFVDGAIRFHGRTLGLLKEQVEARAKKEAWLVREGKRLAGEKAEMKRVLSGPDPYDPQ